MTQQSALSYDAIGRYAEMVGSHYDIYDSASGRADLAKLVNSLGGRSEIASYDSAESLRVDGVGSFTIFVPPFTSSRRDRFTIAHELGHYFLHYLYEGSTSTATFNRGGQDRAETQANVFASSLMMPEQEFRKAHGALIQGLPPDRRFRALARQFDVSPAAAEVRCKVLGLAA